MEYFSQFWNSLKVPHLVVLGQQIIIKTHDTLAFPSNSPLFWSIFYVNAANTLTLMSLKNTSAMIQMYVLFRLRDKKHIKSLDHQSLLDLRFICKNLAICFIQIDILKSKSEVKTHLLRMLEMHLQRFMYKFHIENHNKIKSCIEFIPSHVVYLPWPVIIKSQPQVTL